MVLFGFGFYLGSVVIHHFQDGLAFIGFPESLASRGFPEVTDIELDSVHDNQVAFGCTWLPARSRPASVLV